MAVPIPKCLSGGSELLGQYAQLDALGLDAYSSVEAREARALADEWAVLYLDAITRDFADNLIEPEHAHLALTVVCGLSVRMVAKMRERGR